MRWEHRLNLKQHLTDGDNLSGGHIAVTAAAIAKTARDWMARPATRRKVDAWELDIADLEHACDQLDDLARTAKGTANDLDEILDEIYSWADTHAVWIGGEPQRNTDPSEPGRQAAIAATDNDPNHTAHPTHW